jgi:DNA adenine methylase
MGLPVHLEDIIERLRGVIIEHAPAIEVLRRYDGPETLHYVDPPYVYATRNARNAGDTYRYEMTDAEHRELASTLLVQSWGSLAAWQLGSPLLHLLAH